MSKVSDLVHTSRLEVEILESCVKQTTKHRGRRATKTWVRERKLGQGGFATVYLEKCTEDQEQLRAVKQLPKGGRIDYNRELEAAALFSQKLYEGSFVESFGWYESPEYVFLTMEFLALGDLQRHMNSAFPEPEAALIISQVLEALKYMHERDFTHRDLKPAVGVPNILVCERGPQWWIKLTDFGISKRAGQGISNLHTIVYTQNFVAPEVLFISETYTSAVDVWSAGIIAFLLLSGANTVFPGVPELLKYWSSPQSLPITQLTDRGISDSGLAFVRLLLAPKPEDRPNASACLDLEWITTPALDPLPDDHVEKDVNEVLLGPASNRWTTTDHRNLLDSINGLDIGEAGKPKDDSSAKRPDKSTIKVTCNADPAVSQFAFSPDLTIVATALDCSVRFCNTHSGAPSERQACMNLLERARVLLFSPSGDSLAVVTERNIIVQTLGGKQVSMALSFLCDRVAFSPNESLVACWNSRYPGINILETDNGARSEFSTAMPFSQGCQVAFAPNGRDLAIAFINGLIEIWDIRNGTRRAILQPGQSQLRREGDSYHRELFYHRRGHLVTRVRDGGGEIWHPNLTRSGTHTSLSRGPSASMSSQMLVGFSDSKIDIWNISGSASLIRRFDPEGQVYELTFSPNDNLLAAAHYKSSNNGVSVWNVQTGTLVYRKDSTIASVGIAFSSNGKMFAVALSDGTIELMTEEYLLGGEGKI